MLEGSFHVAPEGAPDPSARGWEGATFPAWLKYPWSQASNCTAPTKEIFSGWAFCSLDLPWLLSGTCTSHPGGAGLASKPLALMDWSCISSRCGAFPCRD